jgi:hypothetical protein
MRALFQSSLKLFHFLLGFFTEFTNERMNHSCVACDDAIDVDGSSGGTGPAEYSM